MDEIKARYRADRKSRQSSEIIEILREVKCFWTRPFGHEYRSYRCVSCGKHQVRSI